jgi:hypothetical protein
MTGGRSHLRVRRLVERLVTQTTKLRSDDEEGLTLIELLIVVVLIPMVIGAVSIVVITSLEATDAHNPLGTAARLADSHDAQITSAYIVRDIQSAQFVSTSISTPLCGTGSGRQLLGLEWTNEGVTSLVTYGVTGAAPYELVRYYCQGSATNLVSTSVVSHDVFNALTSAPAIVTAPSGSCTASDSTCAASGGTNYVTVVVTCNDGTTLCADSGAYPTVAGSFTDGGSSSSTTWTSASAAFNARDVGQAITGSFIPSGTTIASVTNATTVVLSQATTGTGSNLSFQLPGRGIKQAQILIQESASSYPYTLTASPRQWNGAGTAASAGCVSPCTPTAPLLLLGSGQDVSCVGAAGTINVNGIAAINSPNDNSVSLGTSTLNATGVYTADTTNPNGAVSGKAGNYPAPPIPGSPIPDPYASLTPPSKSGMTVYSSGTYQGPGDYTTTLTLSGNGITAFAPGVYYFEQGIKLSGGAGILTAPTPNGVLFYVTGGTVDLTGGGNIDLFPFTGYQNVVIWDTTSTPVPNVLLGGNSGVSTINGVVYDPNGTTSTSGTSTLSIQNLVSGAMQCNGSQTVNLGYGNVAGVVTAPSSPVVSVGSSITDAAIVTGNATVNKAPTGTVSFYICGPGVTSCSAATGKIVGGPVPLSPVGAVIESTATSISFTPAAAGTYCFLGLYSGDLNYGGSSDGSVDECFTAGAAGPTITITSQKTTGAGTTFTGTTTGTKLITIYICAGTVASCTSSSAVATATPSGGSWTSNSVTLARRSTFTAQAYENDNSGNTGQSNVFTFST